ncbi:MAG: cyclophilin-like fold protein [Bacteroidota bacterium]
MKITSLFLSCLIYIQLFACNENEEVKTVSTSNPDNTSTNTNTNITKMKITIGANIFTATFDENATSMAFKAKLPMTINMTELNGNEKFFDLAFNLPTNASNLETIQNGDLMMYGSNTLVLFYKTFSTSYNYTRVGRIENPTGLATALGPGNITVTFELQ